MQPAPVAPRAVPHVSEPSEWASPLASSARNGPHARELARIADKVYSGERITSQEGLHLHEHADLLTLGLARLGIVTLSAKGFAFPSGFHIDAIVTERLVSGTPSARIIPFDMSWTAGDGKPIENLPAIGADKHTSP
jgi:hypothetical protein